MKHDSSFDDDYYDADRYDSAEGWEPENKYRKQASEHRKNHPEEFCFDSMLQVRDANECMKSNATNQTPVELFGGLWQTGELAVLFAEPGVGKSIFAVQLAESIATGAQSSLLANTAASAAYPNPEIHPSSRSQATAREVLYLDFEHSDEQFQSRYSCPSPFPSKPPIKYRFSKKLRRATYGDLEIPAAFKGDPGRYFQHSLNLELGREPAKIIIIDNLSCLDPRNSNPSAAARRMRSLRLYAIQNQASILVITHAKPSRRTHPSSLCPHPLSLNDLALGPQIAEIADTVFAIGRTTFGENFRYIKHLRSKFGPIQHGSANALVYELTRIEVTKAETRPVGSVRSLTPQPASPTSSSGFIPINRDGTPANSLVSQNSQLPTLHSPLTAKPFLALTYLGTAPESDLIRDYEREYHESEAREQKLVKTASDSDRAKRLRSRTSRDILVDGILDGSYQRYIKGE